MEEKNIAEYYGLKDQKISDFKSVTFKPYSLKSKFKVSQALKKVLPFLFGGVVK